MPKKIPENELNLIIEMIKSFPNGAFLADLTRNNEFGSKRTLQRRLKLLVEQQQISHQGHRYYVQQEPITDLPAGMFSPKSEEVRVRITAPLTRRKPIGYQRSFLDSYRPNHSTYLPAQVREHLFQVGRNQQFTGKPSSTYIKKIFHRLLIDLSWNSSRLEGNTYSLLETQRLLEQQQFASGKNTFEAEMILNHKAAIEFLAEIANHEGVSRFSILNLHALLSNNLLPNPASCGKIRTIPVGISQSVYHPLEMPALINECFDQIITTANLIDDPFEQAFFLMVHLPYLQPFEDVNKRVSRLAANIPLIKHDLCPLAFIDVTEQDYINGLIGVYELNQVELFMDVFVWAYERSAQRYTAVRQSLGEPDMFRVQYRESIKTLVTTVVTHLLDKKAATEHIQAYAKNQIPTHDQPHFVGVVETELLSLHEGNIARYQLTLPVFKAWVDQWQ